jgi:hypothetical protein
MPLTGQEVRPLALHALNRWYLNERGVVFRIVDDDFKRIYGSSEDRGPSPERYAGVVEVLGVEDTDMTVFVWRPEGTEGGVRLLPWWANYLPLAVLRWLHPQPAPPPLPERVSSRDEGVPAVPMAELLNRAAAEEKAKEGAAS